MQCVDLGESFHVPFLNLLFEQIANSNEYSLAKIGVDTAENEPLEVWGENSIHYSFASLIQTTLQRRTLRMALTSWRACTAQCE